MRTQSSLPFRIRRRKYHFPPVPVLSQSSILTAVRTYSTSLQRLLMVPLRKLFVAFNQPADNHVFSSSAPKTVDEVGNRLRLSHLFVKLRVFFSRLCTTLLKSICSSIIDVYRILVHRPGKVSTPIFACSTPSGIAIRTQALVCVRVAAARRQVPTLHELPPHDRSR